jgi:FtsH-binding integral membrane protein
MNSISVPQAIYGLFFVLIFFGSAWSFYKQPKDRKKTAQVLLVVVGLSLLMYSLNKSLLMADSTISLENIQATSPKQPSKEVIVSGGGTKYPPLEPSEFSSLQISGPSFGNESNIHLLFSIISSICFAVLIVFCLWKLAQAHLDIYYRDPDNWRFYKKTQKLKGESK